MRQDLASCRKTGRNDSVAFLDRSRQLDQRNVVATRQETQTTLLSAKWSTGSRAEKKVARDPPDPVRVPSFMDNDLGGTDGNGSRLIFLQVVFSQVDPVGATAAWA